VLVFLVCVVCVCVCVCGVWCGVCTIAHVHVKEKLGCGRRDKHRNSRHASKMKMLQTVAQWCAVVVVAAAAAAAPLRAFLMAN